MTDEEFSLCTEIINENMQIVNDKNESEEFREALRNELLEIKAECDKLIILYL